MLHDKCLRCGRKLKDPTARQIGLGSTCAKKVIETGLQHTRTKKSETGLSPNKLFKVGKENGKDTGSDADG